MAFLVCFNRVRSENRHRFKPNSNIRCEILLNIALLVFKAMIERRKQIIGGEHKEFNKSDLRSAREI